MADPIYTPDDPGTSIDDTIAFDEINPLPEFYIGLEELNAYVGRISPVLVRMLARLKSHDGSWIPEGWQMDSRPDGEAGFSVVGGKEFEFTVNYWDADAETAHTGVLPGEGRAVIIQLLTNKDEYSEKFYFVLGHFTASGAPTLAESAESRADSGSYVYIDLPDPTAEVGVVTETVGFLTGTQITPHFQVPELTILLDTGSGEVPAGTVQTVLPTYSAKYVNGQKFLDVAASFVLEGVETEAVSGEFFVDVAHLPVDTSGDSVGSLTWNCVGFAGADVAANFVGAESRVYLVELDQGTGDWTPIVATVDTSTEDIAGELRVRVPLVDFPVLANTELTDFLTFMNEGTAEEFRLGLAAGSAGGKFPLHPSCFGSRSSFSFLHSAKVEEGVVPPPGYMYSILVGDVLGVYLGYYPAGSFGDLNPPEFNEFEIQMMVIDPISGPNPQPSLIIVLVASLAEAGIGGLRIESPETGILDLHWLTCPTSTSQYYAVFPGSLPELWEVGNTYEFNLSSIPPPASSVVGSAEVVAEAFSLGVGFSSGVAGSVSPPVVGSGDIYQFWFDIRNGNLFLTLALEATGAVEAQIIPAAAFKSIEIQEFGLVTVESAVSVNVTGFPVPQKVWEWDLGPGTIPWVDSGSYTVTFA